MSELLFATNRNRLDRSDPPKFGGELSGEIHYGYRDEDGRAHTLEPDEFLDRIQSSLSQGRDVLNFMHGFYADFESTLEKGAKVAQAYATPSAGAEREVVVCSWPSVGRLLGYEQDYANALASGKQFAEVIQSQLSLESAAGAIHTLSQSFGNVALMATVQELKLKKTDEPKLAQVILTAPVLPEDAFEDAAQLLPLSSLAQRVTVYYNPDDFGQYFKGLLAADSYMQTKGPLRASLPQNVVVVNTDPVLRKAHQFYLYSKDVVNDVYQAINGVAADSSSLARRFVKRKQHYELFKR